MKMCSRCGETKTLSEYFINTKRKDGVQTYCKPCHLEYGRERYSNPKAYTRRQMNRDEYAKRRKASGRKWYLKSMYNLTEEQYEELHKTNNGLCWICNEKTNYHLHVDHNHKCCLKEKSCGKCVRGLLCYNCNTLLGNAKDNASILKSAIRYLELRKDGIIIS